MNLTTLLASFGMGDGEGNTSSMRLIVALIVLSVLAPAVYSAFATHTPLTLTADNLELIGGALSFKCIQNAQEKSSPAAPKTPPVAAA